MIQDNPTYTIDEVKEYQMIFVENDDMRGLYELWHLVIEEKKRYALLYLWELIDLFEASRLMIILSKMAKK